MRERIRTLDGLRFLAALGVLWVHSWSKFGNPRFYVGKIDIANLLAIGGNGVDLFFVISGFCMYYFYAPKERFSYWDYSNFILKRWARLSPAFYTATIVYILTQLLTLRSNINVPAELLTSCFYLNSIFTQYSPAAHFWTLGVEYQFYFTIPFLLIYQSRSGFAKVLIGLYGSLLVVSVATVLIFKAKSDMLTNQIFFRSIEFAFGIMSARLLLISNIKIRFRMLWMLLFLLITYCGRILISKQILLLSPSYYNLFKLLGFCLMGCGFAGILFLSVTSSGVLNKLLGNRLFKTMGKISYSFYLWHVLVIQLVSKFFFISTLSHGLGGSLVSTLVSALVLYPISLLSYNLLEKPFLSVRILAIK